MDICLLDRSIVIVAKNHNPTILNQDFLKRNLIIEEDVKPLSVICTDVFAQVVLSNGINIVSEPTRVIFTQIMTPDANVLLPEIVIKYVTTLPHVLYTAAGFNFTSNIVFPSIDQATEFFMSLIKDTPIKVLAKPISGKLSMSYVIDNYKLNVTLEPVNKAAENDRQKDGINIRSNFHFDLPDHHPVSIEFFKRIARKSVDFEQTHLTWINSILGGSQ